MTAGAPGNTIGAFGNLQRKQGTGNLVVSGGMTCIQPLFFDAPSGRRAAAQGLERPVSHHRPQERSASCA